MDTGFFEGKPCGENDVCASGYTCVQEPCGEGYLCKVCRQHPAADAGRDAGPDAGDRPADGEDGTEDGGGEQEPNCEPVPPPCKDLLDCQDAQPECIEGVWVCDTGYESPERSCDQLDNDCDGQTDVGLICRLAGDGDPGLLDGPGVQARFDRPRALLALPDGAVLVADTGNHAIRRVEPDGTTTTLAGCGHSGDQDGPATQACFREPSGLALTVEGTVLVADRLNHRIRAIDASGQVSTFAGSGFVDYLDGPSADAHFAFPTSVALGADGSLFVADAGNHCIRKIEIAAGQVSTFSGLCEHPGIADGDKATARFNNPTDLLLLQDGRLLVAEASSHRIRAVSPDGTVSTLAGDGVYGFVDGPRESARFKNPAGMLEDAQHGILVADRGNHRIRAIAEEVSSWLGSGQAGLEDGPPDLVELNRPSGLARLGDGRLVIADTTNHALRVLNP